MVCTPFIKLVHVVGSVYAVVQLKNASFVHDSYWLCVHLSPDCHGYDENIPLTSQSFNFTNEFQLISKQAPGMQACNTHVAYYDQIDNLLQLINAIAKQLATPVLF